MFPKKYRFIVSWRHFRVGDVIEQTGLYDMVDFNWLVGQKFVVPIEDGPKPSVDPNINKPKSHKVPHIR